MLLREVTPRLLSHGLRVLMVMFYPRVLDGMGCCGTLLMRIIGGMAILYMTRMVTRSIRREIENRTSKSALSDFSLITRRWNAGMHLGRPDLFKKSIACFFKK